MSAIIQNRIVKDFYGHSHNLSKKYAIGYKRDLDASTYTIFKKYKSVSALKQAYYDIMENFFFKEIVLYEVNYNLVNRFIHVTYIKKNIIDLTEEKS